MKTCKSVDIIQKVVGHGWKDTIELKVGDKIESNLGKPLTVKSVTDEKRNDVTYNFTVADFHTNYDTKLNVLVHKCGDGDWIPLSEAGSLKAASDEFNSAHKNASKQAHSGRGHKRLQAQAKALEGFIKENKKNFDSEYMKPIENEAKRLRSRARAYRHK